MWKIAEKYYGSGQYWKKIFEDNKDVIINPDKIYVGQVIVIILEQGEGSETIAGTLYTVQSGDTLYKIAEEFYGKGWKWSKIYSTNFIDINCKLNKVPIKITDELNLVKIV